MIDSWLQELGTSTLAQSLTVVATAGGDTPEAKVAIPADLLLIVSYLYGIPFIEFDCAHPQLVRQSRQQHREIHVYRVSYASLCHPHPLCIYKLIIIIATSNIWGGGSV